MTISLIVSSFYKYNVYPARIVIVERLSVKLIIVQAQWALVGPLSKVVLVCMSVHNGFTIELMHSLHTFWHVLLRMPSHNGIVSSPDPTRTERVW